MENLAEKNGPRLLIFDDNTGVCNLIQAYAETINFQVSIAYTGNDFKEQYLANPPHGILFDLWVSDCPYETYFEFLSHHQCTCPIAIFSGMNKALRDQAFGVGKCFGLLMLNTLEKPINFTELMKTLKIIETHAMK